MQKKEPIIGIDLGTTNSCAAYVDESGNVKLIPYKGGDYTIPSIFAIDDKGNELIGYEAKRQWQLNPRNTVYGAKRLVGRGYKSDIVDTMKKVVAYQMRPGKKNDVVLDVGQEGVLAPGGQREDPQQDPRRGLQPPEGAHQARGGDGAGVLQRSAAPVGEGRRQADRSRGGAHHQRAHRGGAGLRRGQEPQGEGGHLRSGRRHVRRVHHRDPRSRLRGEGHRRRHLPGRHRLRQRDHPPRAQGLRGEDGHRSGHGSGGHAAHQGPGRAHEDRLVRARGGALQHPVHHDDVAGPAAEHRDEVHAEDAGAR